MILELNGTKVTIVDKTLGYQGDNLVDTIQVTVDKDSTWNYKLDMYKGKSKRFDSVLMVREGNICTVQLTNEILSYGGRYVFQLRGYTDTQTYHSDIFESWVNASIEYQDDCKQGDCECDCKLPTEFYQVEDNVTEINNHPPYPGDNNKWMIWDVNKHEYVESDIEVVGGGGGDYQTKANLTTSITAESTDEQYPSAKATYEYGQSIVESAGKINAITVNGTAQTVEDKTAKIIVNKSTVGLGNVNNTSDNDKPVSSAQASAIADAKQAGTTAQANLDAHISNKENPHEVTKSQVGLSDVDNTSDKNKPVSTPQATAIADAKKAGTDAQANLTAHINDKENPHEVTKAQVGLGDVDNTSDVNKPISTATQTALNGKLDKTAVVDVTVEALKGQAADAKSVYDTIQALPTGTDISLGVTSASVGDIIKVKAVDASGKPTAWEAATAKLANPNALTFTGAVTGSYDGSVAKTIEIPSGGGGGVSYRSWSKVWTLAVAEDIAGFEASNIDLDGKSEIMIVFISDSTASRTMANGRLLINGVDVGKVLFNSLPLKKDSHSFIIIGRADEGIEYTTMGAKAEYQTYPWQGDVNVVHRMVRGTNSVISWIADSTIEITQGSATLGQGITIEIYVR